MSDRDDAITDYLVICEWLGFDYPKGRTFARRLFRQSKKANRERTGAGAPLIAQLAGMIQRRN